MRLFLGQDPDAPVQHPSVYSAHGTRIMGITLPVKPGDTAAIDPFGGMPGGMQFLLDFGPVRRQRQFYQLF
jgi:hypothetical protein